MRTLVNIKDVLAEYHKTLDCPHCRIELPVVQATLDFRRGSIFIQRKGYCETHGCISETKMVRAIQMHGKDAQIIPQVLADRKEVNNDGSTGTDQESE